MVQDKEIYSLEIISRLESFGIYKSRIKNLKKLYVDANKITEIDGLEELKLLERLSFSANKIEEIKGLEQLHNLVFWI